MRGVLVIEAGVWIALTLVCLLYLPGATLMRALRLQTLGYVRHIYAVGLSVAFDMFTGFILDILGPSLGAANPISQTPILVVIGASVVLIAVGAYARDRNSAEILSGPKPPPVSAPAPTVPYFLLAGLILCLGVLAPALLNTYGSNIGVYALFALVATVPLLMAIRAVPTSVNPILIFACALALLYHRSLASDYVTGWDIQYEYYFAHLTVNNHLANVQISSNVGAMLSTTIFAPEIALTTNVDLAGVFKWVYPLIYALMPVGLYALFAAQLPPRFAFFSAFLVISTFIFYQVMLDLPRQQIAELFLVSFLLIAISESIPRLRRTILALVFSLSIIVSHYSISYAFGFGLIISTLFLGLLRRRWGSLPGRISTAFTTLYLVTAISWYLYTSQSSVLNSLVKLLNHVISSLATELLSPSASQPVAIASSTFPLLHTVTEFLYAVVTGAILWGFFVAVRKRGITFMRPYMAFSFSGLVLLVLVVTLPYVAAALNFNRFYQIALLLTAPFAVVPFLYSRQLQRVPKRTHAVIVATFLATFLLFSSGMVYELGQEPSLSMSFDSGVDYPRFVPAEVAATSWLASHLATNATIYADGYRGLLLVGYFGVLPRPLEQQTALRPGTNYVYLGSWNTEYQQILVFQYLPAGLKAEHLPVSDTNLEDLLRPTNLIYSSGSATIFESAA